MALAPFKLPQLQQSIAIVDPGSGRPSPAFVRYWNLDFIGAIERQVNGLAEVQAEIIATQEDLQDQVDRLTAVLAGTGEPFTGVNVGGTNVKPLLDKSNGARFDDVTAIPGNTTTVSGTRDGLVMTAEGEGVGPFTSAQVTVSAHTFSVGGTLVSLDGGVIGGLTIGPTLRYYIYYDDPAYAGGSVTYAATQAIADLSDAPGRFVLGYAIMPNSGGVGGATTVATPSWSF